MHLFSFHSSLWTRPQHDRGILPRHGFPIVVLVQSFQVCIHRLHFSITDGTEPRTVPFSKLVNRIDSGGDFKVYTVYTEYSHRIIVTPADE